jgi:hypothetical protein
MIDSAGQCKSPKEEPKKNSLATMRKAKISRSKEGPFNEL